MARELAIKQDLKDDQGRIIYTAFSTDGRPKSHKEFEQAYVNFQQGEPTEGLTFLEPGTLSHAARTAYETVNQPVQQALSTGGRWVGENAATAGYQALGGRLGLFKPEARQMMQQVGGNIGQNVGEFVGSQFKTPEAGVTTLGNIGAAVATGGASLPTQIAATSLGSGASSLLGGVLMGSGSNPGRALVDGITAGLAQGALGIFRLVTNRGMSQTASNQVRSKVDKLIHEELQHIATDPRAFQAYANTPDGISKLIGFWSEGLRGDHRAFTDDIIKTINNRAPHSLSRQQTRIITDLAEDYFKTGDDMIGNLQNRGGANELKGRLIDIQREMLGYIDHIYTNNPGPATNRVVKELKDILFNHVPNLNKYRDYIEVLSALKNSGTSKGFDLTRFREELLKNPPRRSGSLMERVYDVAGRGRPLTQSKDKTIFKGYEIGLPIFKKGISLPAMGKYYGPGLGKEPANVGVASFGRSAIEDFRRGEGE